MKKIIILSFILIYPIICTAQHQEIKKQVIKTVHSFKPDISLSEALSIAEGYIKENRIDISEQYINNIRLLYDNGSSQEVKKDIHWHIQCAWSPPRLGGEFSPKIYMDGTIIPRVCGP